MTLQSEGRDMGVYEGLDGDLDQTCENCRFFSPSPDGMSGDCRRYAPRPQNFPDNDQAHRVDTYWANMSIDDWCGEFQRHPAKKPAP